MRWREIIGEAEVIKPEPPLDASKWAKEAERRRRTSRRIRDAQATCAKKVNDLKSDL